MRERRPERLDALRTRLEENDLDGLIVSHLPNIRYLSGFSGSSAVLLVLRTSLVFVSDSRYRTQAADEIGDLARIEIAAGSAWPRLAEILKECLPAGRVGYEAHVVTSLQCKRNHDLLDPMEPVSTTGLVEQLRVSKDAAEVAAIREAAVLAGEALESVIQRVRVGQRELDVAGELERELRSRGSEWHPFPTIVASGSNSALPHAQSTERQIQAGDWLLLDFGAQVDGYCADITRTFVVGRRADDRQRAVYQVVREAQGLARQGIRSGMAARAADALARSHIEAAGFGDAFGHSLGHGLGLEVHEAPRVSTTNEAPLPERSVVTIEPGVYFAGWGGVRIEDDVYLGRDGPEALSNGTTELVELT